MNRLRTMLYTAARLLGDINAIRQGPEAIAKRLVRKLAGRVFGKFMGRL